MEIQISTRLYGVLEGSKYRSVSLFRFSRDATNVIHMTSFIMFYRPQFIVYVFSLQDIRIG